jgi:hypothetical protein
MVTRNFIRTVSLAAAVAGTVGGMGSAHADLRSFTHTYEYATMPEGKTAVELWHTQTKLVPDASSPQAYQGILEIEHGITEHWDIAFYTVLQQIAAGDESDPLHLSEAKIETRYRLAERGELPIDTLLYLEVAKAFGESEYELEGKVIGARDFGDLTVAANAIAEVAVGKDVPESELELGFAAGATYQAHPKFRVGVETWGEIEDGEVYLDAGPALCWAAAPNFWTTATFGFSLTERDEAEGINHGAFSARLIMGIEL